MNASEQRASDSRPVWFGDPDPAQFGWLHYPADSQVRGGVVLCAPLGQEYRNAHHTFAILAGRLASHGFAVLRYDHPGTGDSAGGPRETGWVGDWRRGLGHAVEVLKDIGCPAVSVVGMRIGATIAAAEVNAIGPLDALVLWDPCLSGGRFVRQQKVLGAVVSGTLPTEEVGAFVQGPGFLLPPEMTTSLRWLDDPDLTPLGGVDHALVLLRDPTAIPASLGSWLAPISHEVVLAAGQPELVETASPFHLIPTAAIDVIATWMDATLSSQLTPVDVPDRTVATIHLPGGATVHEEALRFGPDLFGIKTTPNVGSQDLAAVFVNEGVDHHVGPGNLWVDLARDLGAIGVTSLRFDLSGIGDSPPHPGEPSQLVHSPTAFADVAAAAALVSKSSSRFVMMGLCSGGYQVLEAALTERPLAVCAVNPLLGFDPPETRGGASPMDPARKFCIPPGRVVDAARTSPRLNRLAERWPKLTWRVRHLLFGGRSSARRFEELVGLGVRTLVLCGAYESTALLQINPRLFAELEKTGVFHVETIENFGHALPTLSDRDLTKSHLLDFVLGFLPDVRTAPVASPAGPGPDPADGQAVTTMRGS